MRLLWSVMLFSLVLPGVLSIKCWLGWQIWEHNINNVTQQHCAPKENCCYMIASAESGTNWGCAQCPPENTEKCGPDPRLGIQDLRYCYCKNQDDSDCQPYLGDQ